MTDVARGLAAIAVVMLAVWGWQSWDRRQCWRIVTMTRPTLSVASEQSMIVSGMRYKGCTLHYDDGTYYLGYFRESEKPLSERWVFMDVGTRPREIGRYSDSSINVPGKPEIDIPKSLLNEGDSRVRLLYDFVQARYVDKRPVLRPIELCMTRRSRQISREASYALSHTQWERSSENLLTASQDRKLLAERRPSDYRVYRGHVIIGEKTGSGWEEEQEVAEMVFNHADSCAPAEQYA